MADSIRGTWLTAKFPMIIPRFLCRMTRPRSCAMRIRCTRGCSRKSGASPKSQPPAGRVRDALLLLADDHADFDASVLGVGFLGIAIDGRTVGAIAVRIERVGGQTEPDKIFAYGKRAAFTQGAVIFRRAALVRVAGQEERVARV